MPGKEKSEAEKEGVKATGRVYRSKAGNEKGRTCPSSRPTEDQQALTQRQNENTRDREGEATATMTVDTRESRSFVSMADT